MQREINIRLNANRAKAVHTGLKFASGDKGIVFKIAVDELDTAGTTAKIVFKRSNGTSVEAEVTVTDGICSYTTLGNEFAVVGPVTADVKFYEGEKRISTCTFVFDVTSDTLDGIGTGTAGYSDTLEQMKKSMEQTQREMLAVKNDLESRAEEILEQMQKTAEEAEGDVEAAEKKMADLATELEALYQEYVDAFGSTGPFNPRGPYSETESYTVRDMVTYDDASWVCYRNCTGATPSRDSDCWQHFTAGTSESLQDIIDGTTQVGNAKTLDGHGAEDFLSSSGGMINGDVALNKDSDVLLYMMLKNTLRQINLEVQKGGAFRLRDATNSKDIINSTVDGTTTFNGKASGNLPLTGGTVENITLSPLAINRSNTSANQVALCFKLAGTALAHIGAKLNGDLYALDGSGADVGKLLHTGNKPTGTYTGNGSARDISVGGIGGIIAVRGNDHNMIVTGSGAFGCKLSNGAFVVENSNVSKFINGKLSLAENSVLNAEGLNFPYEVL